MQKKNQRIVVTGGGSGGHTIPALVMIQHWKNHAAHEVHYLGSILGIEKKVVSEFVDKYHAISTGKLRRYLSVENFLDFFRFIKGIIQSLILLIQIKPKVVFSTGGFVALPVVIAAKVLGIRVVIHEQTTHVGLANKLSSYFANAICISFKSSEKYFPSSRTFFTGYPLRSEFYHLPSKLESFQNKAFFPGKKILLILGGGNGSLLLNNFVANNLQILCSEFNVVLQTGAQYESEFAAYEHPHLWKFSFLQKEMINLLVTADYVVARSGAGTVCELIHLQKACLFVPLSIAQKNEQWFNAQTAVELIGSKVIIEADWKKISVAEVIECLKSIKVPSKKNISVELKTPVQKIDELLFL